MLPSFFIASWSSDRILLEWLTLKWAKEDQMDIAIISQYSPLSKNDKLLVVYSKAKIVPKQCFSAWLLH